MHIVQKGIYMDGKQNCYNCTMVKKNWCAINKVSIANFEKKASNTNSNYI